MTQPIDVPGIGIVEFPDGMNDEQIAAAIRSNAPAAKPAAAQPAPSGGNPYFAGAGDALRRAAGGATEPLMTLGSGAISTPLAGIAGLAGSALPGPEGQGADWARSIMQKGTYQPRSEGGQDAMKVIGYPFEKLGELAQYGGETTQDLTGSPAAAAGVNTAISLAPMLLGSKLSPRQGPGVLTNIFGSAEHRAGNLAGEVAGDNKAAVIAALRGHQNQIPGSQATAGQAAVPAGSAEFSALQEIVANRAPSKYGTAGIEGAQEAARQGAAESIAKTPADLSAALRARAQATGPMREANLVSANVLQGGVKADALIQALDAKLSTPGLRGSDVVQKSLGAVRDKIAALGEKTGTVDAKDLYTIRKEAGNTISTFAKETANWDKRLTGGLQKDVQGIIDAAIEKAGGSTWKDYLARYGDMSGPINRMETGRVIADALRNSLGTAERPTTFANAVEKAKGEQSFATGKARMADLTPAEQGLVEAIKGELARDATFARMAREGVQETNRRLSTSVPELPPSGMFSPLISVTRGLYNRFAGKVTESTLQELAKKMDNPQEMARIMDIAMPKQRSQLADVLMRYRYSGAAVPQLQGQQR